jgi:hypothetical protein
MARLSEDKTCHERLQQARLTAKVRVNEARRGSDAIAYG